MPKEDADMSIGKEMVDFLERQLSPVDVRPKMALEFGTGAGTATTVIAKYAAKLVTVDHDPKWTRHAKQKLASDLSRPYDNIIFITGYDNIPTFDEPYDFVFVDGPPDVAGGRKNTLLKYWDRLATTAVIVFDDTNRKKIQNFVKDIAKEKNCAFVLSVTGRGIGVIVKS